MGCRCRVQWVVDVGFSGLSMPGLVSCRCRVQWVVDAGFSELSM